MEMRGIDLVGVDYGGLVASIFNTAGAAVDVAQQSQAEQSANNKRDTAIAADRAATNAVWKANASAAAAEIDKSKAGTAKADKMAADKAVQVQDKAGADMPASKRDERVKAAQTAVDAAQTDMQDALRSGDKAKQMSAQAEMDAAQQTLGKAQGTVPEGNTGAGKGGKGAGGSWGTDSFFTAKVVGSVKVWHALVAAVAAAGGVYLWKRK